MTSDHSFLGDSSSDDENKGVPFQGGRAIVPEGATVSANQIKLRDGRTPVTASGSSQFAGCTIVVQSDGRVSFKGNKGSHRTPITGNFRIGTTNVFGTGAAPTSYTSDGSLGVSGLSLGRGATVTMGNHNVRSNQSTAPSHQPLPNVSSKGTDATYELACDPECCDSDQELEENKHESYMRSNRGHIFVNSGELHRNWGRVDLNAKSGLIKGNQRHISVNEGHIEFNAGTVGVNRGTIGMCLHKRRVGVDLNPDVKSDVDNAKADT